MIHEIPELKNLHPAQTLLLLHGRYTSLANAMSVIFQDMVRRKLITLSKRTLPGVSQRDKPRTSVYVRRGPALKGYSPAPFEEYFMVVWRSDTELIRLADYINVAYEAFDLEIDFVESIIDDRLRTYIYTSSFLFFSKVRRTKQGKRLAETLQDELRKLDATLPKLLKTEPKKGREIMKRIGGNVFLLKTVKIKDNPPVSRFIDMIEKRGSFDSVSLADLD